MDEVKRGAVRVNEDGSFSTFDGEAWRALSITQPLPEGNAEIQDADWDHAEEQARAK